MPGGRPCSARATHERIFGELEAKRSAGAVAVTTDDGSAGRRGTVADALPDEIERTGASTVYACGPMPMLRAVGAVAAAAGLPCQVAVEESMACGIGVCMTCVLPVVGDGRGDPDEPVLRGGPGVRAATGCGGTTSAPCPARGRAGGHAR